jgi:hypothetical protein
MRLSMGLVPLFLVLTAMSSGCTVPILGIEIPGLPDFPGFGPTVVEYEHDVLVIKSLEAIPSEIDAGQTTKLIAYIENVGDRTVGETAGKSNWDVEIELYDYCQGLFTPSVTTCRGSATGTKCTIGKILPGEIVPVVWTLEQKGDVKLKTICPPDGMKVSVKYPFSTNSLTTISFITKEELERSLEQRETKSTESYIVVGEGPIKPYLTVEDKQPIPVYDGARTSLQLVLKNAGSGSLASTYNENIAGTVREVNGLEGSAVEVTGLGGVNGMKPESDCKFKDGRLSEDVRLIGKESQPLLCRLDLSNLDGSFTRTATRHVEVEVDEYEYMFTKSVQVVVNPKFAG